MKEGGNRKIEGTRGSYSRDLLKLKKEERKGSGDVVLKQSLLDYESRDLIIVFKVQSYLDDCVQWVKVCKSN